MRLSSKSSTPAAAIHMRQFGHVTPWRDHSIWASVWRKQVARFLQRRPRPQQRRAADRNDDVFEQPVGAKSRIFAGAEADADIDVVAIEIAHFIGDVEAQLDAGLLLAKIIDAPHQPFRRELGVQRYFQQRRAARRLLRPRDGPAKQVERIGRGLGQHRARLGQPDGAAGAREQHQAELVLDFLDLVADRGRRQAELVGGAGEIEVPGRRFQRPQRHGFPVAGGPWANSRSISKKI